MVHLGGSTCVCSLGCEFSVSVTLSVHPSPGSQMMALLIPLYISILFDPSTSDLRTLPKAQVQVHEFFLQRVTLIGPKYPEAFRNVMQASPGLKLKLESAVRSSQSAARTKGPVPLRGKGAGNSGIQPQQQQQQQQPSIKLKMDFSNFK